MWNVLSRALKGKLLILSSVLTAVIALAVPALYTRVVDSLSEPLKATVVEDNGDNHTIAFLMPLNREDIAGKDTSYFLTAAQDGRAVKAGQQGVKIVLQGGSSHEVVITNVRANVISRDAPIAAALWDAEPQGSSGNLRLGIELADADPVAREISDKGLLGPHFQAESYLLRKDETATFYLTVHATGASFTYNIKIDYTVDGDLAQLELTPSSGPLRLTSFSSSYGAVVESYSGAATMHDSATYCQKTPFVCTDEPR